MLRARSGAAAHRPDLGMPSGPGCVQLSLADRAAAQTGHTQQHMTIAQCQRTASCTQSGGLQGSLVKAHEGDGGVLTCVPRVAKHMAQLALPEASYMYMGLTRAQFAAAGLGATPA